MKVSIKGEVIYLLIFCDECVCDVYNMDLILVFFYLQIIYITCYTDKPLNKLNYHYDFRKYFLLYTKYHRYVFHAFVMYYIRITAVI
jgi:hypothetical protein